MSLVTFDSQAAALVKDLQRQVGMLSAPVEQALAQVQQAEPAKPLSLQQVEQVLLSAMPEQKSVIQGSCQRAACYHPDNKNPRFLTQILSMKIEKESDFVVHPNPVNVAPIRRDPLYASFTMDPKADFMLLFNARDVDRNGQPLLMKVVARERADISKLDLTRYRMQDPTKPDVVKVSNDQSYVETKDINEAEFQFGDPLKQVSVGAEGKELSTSVWVRPENVNKEFAFNGMWDPNTSGASRRIIPNRASPAPQNNRVTQGEGLDRTAVATFQDRVHLSLKAKDTLPQGAWLDTPGAGAHLEAALSVDRGYMFEPGSKAGVAFSGATINLEVAKNDAQLLGSESKAVAVPVSPSSTIRQLLSQNIGETTSANPTNADQTSRATAASALLFARAADIGVGAGTLSVLGDVPVAKANMAANLIKLDAVPAADDDNDAATVRLTLDEGFLAGKNGASVKGYKIVAGFTDEKGVWQEAKTRAIGSDKNKKETFSFDVGDFDEMQKKNANLEVRIFNESGVPATRVLLPFRDIGWGD